VQAQIVDRFTHNESMLIALIDTDEVRPRH